MNVIKIYGGLGNQFFQYAFGRAMEKNGIDVAYQTEFFNHRQALPRPYCLDKFHTKDIKKSEFIKGNMVIHENSDLYYDCSPSLLTAKDCNFYGYWQNVGYYEDIFPELKKEFILNSDYYSKEYAKFREMIIGSESTAVHIRRTDYVTVDGHHNLSMEYYHNAIDIISKKHNHFLFIFSDDIEWCKENFNGAVKFVDLNEWLSFDLMRFCKNKIIANSTYSWWAAKLHPWEDGIIVAPTRWRVNQVEQNRIDKGKFVPTNWIQL
jgi:hypothetical protein